MKAPRIIGLDLANAIALPGLFLASFALVLTDQYTKLSGSEFDFLRDIWACVFVFVSGMIATVMMRNSYRRSLKQKRYFLRKGTVFVVLGLVMTAIWPVNILVLLGVMFIVTPWIALLNSAILRFIAILIFLSALLISLVSASSSIPHSIDLAPDNYDSLVDYFMYMLTSGRYALLPFAGFYVAGMTFARQNFLDKRLFKLNSLLGVIGVILGIGVQAIWGQLFPSNVSDLATQNLPFAYVLIVDLPAFVILGTSIPILVVNSMIWVSRRFKNNSVLMAFAKLGSIKHSAYLNHLIIGILLLFTFNPHFFYRSRWVMVLVTVVYIANFVFAYLWKKRHNLGPFEWFINQLSGSHEKS